MNIVKISGKPGSGKSQLLAIAAAGSPGRNYRVVAGSTTADGIAKAMRGNRDSVLCIDDCSEALLDAIQAHPELARGDVVSRVYAAMTEPVAVPGPWKVGLGYEQEDVGFYIQDAKGMIILSSDTTPTKSTMQTIQAAPVLLKALEKLRAAFVVAAGENSPFCKTSLAAVDEAIKAAGGGV